MSAFNKEPQNCVNNDLDDLFLVKNQTHIHVDEIPTMTFKTKPLSEYQSQVNLKSNPCQDLYIMSSCGDQKVNIALKVFIDSDSSMSLLNQRHYDLIPDEVKPPIHKSDKQVRFADGSVKPCEGMVYMNLEIGSEVRQVAFLLGTYSDEVILGMSDLRAFGFKIDFDKMLVTKDDIWIPVMDSQSNPVGRSVIVRRTCVIPARTQILYNANVQGLGNSMVESSIPMILDTNEQMISEFGILPAKALYQEIDEGSVPVLLYNPEDEDKVLEPGLEIGKFEEVDMVTETVQSTVTSSDVKCNAAHLNTENVLPSHVQDLYERSCVHLDESQRKELKQFFIANSDVFSTGDFDLGSCNLVQHTIDTQDAEPIKFAPRRLSPEARIAADELVDKLLEHKLIRYSKSAWAAPLVMVRKKDNSYRMCCDFRVTCNSVSKMDSYPLPRIDETLESLSSAKWFSTCDMASGYWQVHMDPGSIEKTAFCTRKGLFEWVRMPFGLNTAVATFQRLVSSILGDMQYDCALAYIDDLVLYHLEYSGMLSAMTEMCCRLRKAQLKLKPAKCSFFQRQILFLGHKISEAGIETDPAKIEAVKNWQIPKDKKGVKSFLGSVGYYRKFIPNYSAKAKPLTALTSAKSVFKWDQSCTDAFNELRENLISAPI